MYQNKSFIICCFNIFTLEVSMRSSLVRFDCESLPWICTATPVRYHAIILGDGVNGHGEKVKAILITEIIVKLRRYLVDYRLVPLGKTRVKGLYLPMRHCMTLCLNSYATTVLQIGASFWEYVITTI
jgi:hypothetical protein